MVMSLVVTIRLNDLPTNRPNCRKVLDCASPLALLKRGTPFDSARGRAQSKTLSRDWSSSLCRNHPLKHVGLQHYKQSHEHRQREAVPEHRTQHRARVGTVGTATRRDAGDDDALGVNHFAHDTAGTIRSRRENWRKVELLRRDLLKITEQNIG